MQKLYFLVLIFFTHSSFAVGEGSSIRWVMTDAEFHATGLHKLSETELAQLSAWILQRQGQVTSDPESRFGQEQLKNEAEKTVPESISSHIQGEFRGWKGSTTFRLANGQVWQQRVGGSYRSAPRSNSEVIINRGRFGYYLKIVETGRSVGVKRIH